MCCILVSPYFAQQDPQYSQYQFNQMVINPAYAGNRDVLSVVIDIRKQWSGFQGTPNTQSLSFHGPLKNKRIGLGFSAYNDAIGPKKATSAYGNISYILPLNNKFKLSFGLRGGFVNYRFDFNKIQYKDAGETAALSQITANITKADIDAGLFLKSNSFFTGLSITHINNANIINEKINYTDVLGQQRQFNLDYKLSPHLFAIISKGFLINDNLVFNPCIMYKSTKAAANVDFNLNFLIDQKIWLGVYTKSDATLGFLMQVLVKNNLRIGYSFETGISKLQRQLGRGHEIMIGYDFNTFKSKTLSPRYL